MTKQRILVLGAMGMLGRTVFKYFSERNSYLVFGTSRTADKNFYFLDVNKGFSLNEILNQIGNTDYVINCIGVLKNNRSKKFSINYTLTNHLEKLQKKYKFKLIHVSTDDVFNTISEKVNENDKPSPDNPYAKSKLKGELSSDLSINIRTSIIGFDSMGKKGLIEFVKNNIEVNGYIDQIWSGCTTLQFAKFCKYLTENDHFTKLRNKTSVIHFAPLGPITKYKLLKLISKQLNTNTKVHKLESNQKITRKLNSIYFDKKFLQRYTTETDKAINELRRFENR